MTLLLVAFFPTLILLEKIYVVFNCPADINCILYSYTYHITYLCCCVTYSLLRTIQIVIIVCAIIVGVILLAALLIALFICYKCFSSRGNMNVVSVTVIIEKG